ncbi:uncharacterized protein LOC110975262 [Acanthaster planci]|uniref:Uncharacterized protein LOC110975262 n=1 Tax=Acanthaster planci TaxID=133434 RepID=A0A8B7XSU2_ACAPL|nr:uncharacterized protein LOC110975262 [Acanthaster planci]
MRDKQNPGDTYNYKEHVYADPVALRNEIEDERQQKVDKQDVKKYQQPSSPPPVPGGPRNGTSGNGLYSELAKKTNLPKSTVRDLASLFGGTVPRTQRDKAPEDLLPPPVPEVTGSRNVFETPPDSPVKTTVHSASTVLNILSDETAPCHDETPEEGVYEPNFKEEETNVCVDLEDVEEPPPQILNAQPISLEESLQASSPEPDDEAQVVIDVRINSEAGIEIGAEIPTVTEDANCTDDDGGIRLIKNVKRDPFAVETGNTGEASTASTAPVGIPVPAKLEHGSETGSGGGSSSGSTKRKKKAVESGINSAGHMRRHLIIISLFLLIVLILVLVAVVVLINYTEIFA